MGKPIKIRDVSSQKDDLYAVEVLAADGTRTPLVMATASDLTAGTDTNKIVSPAASKAYLFENANTTPGTLESSKLVLLGGGGQMNWGSITPTFAATVGRDASFIKMGTWATPISITQTGDHWVAIQVNLKKKGDIAFDTAAARFRVDTDGAQPQSAVGCLQLRQNLAHNLASSAILNASVNVSAAVAVQTGSILGGYFSIEGSGAITKAGANDCTPLVAVNNNTGGGVDNVFVAMQNGTGKTVTEIVKIVCTHGTATNGLHIYNTATDGTMTTAIKVFGALTNFFDFTGASGAITEDNKAAPDKAGTIKILTPGGNVGYINYYDGTPTT